MAQISYQIGTEFRAKKRRIANGRPKEISAGPSVQIRRVSGTPVNATSSHFGQRASSPAIGGLTTASEGAMLLCGGMITGVFAAICTLLIRGLLAGF